MRNPALNSPGMVPEDPIFSASLVIPSKSERSTVSALRALGWDSKVKIIEFDVETPAVARSLAQCGFRNYLGLARDSNHLAALRAVAPEIASHFQLMQWLNLKDQMTFHNADVMVLSGSGSSYVRYAMSRRHVRSILWRPSTLVQRTKAWSWILYKRARGVLGPLRNVLLRDAAGQVKNFWGVRRLRVQPIASHRRYINPEGGLSAFFEQLDQVGIRYVVLRWFENLPHREPGEDIDLMVADEDWSKLAELLDTRPGVIPCDVYTCAGLAGSDWNGIPYYPPQVASEVIRSRVRYAGQFYVPCPEHHFLSLAYHAVYHKGAESGLPTGEEMWERGTYKQPEHPYAEAISRLGEQIGMTINPTLPSLHAVLRERGWTPNTDTLRKLSLENPWLETVLPVDTHDPRAGELVVFVVREWAALRDLVPEIARRLEAAGLRIIKIKELDRIEREAASRSLRGGKWGAPHPGQLSAGGPAALIVAFDPAPRELSSKERAKYPHVRNANVLLKHELRHEMCADLPVEERPNFIHSADDEIEAWEYLRLACPSMVEEISQQVAELREGGLAQPVCLIPLANRSVRA